MPAEPAKQASTGVTKSPVNWALLGLVIQRPSYGHELFNRFERTYGHVMPLSGGSHIYGALGQLERLGLIESYAGNTVTRQPKPHYRATKEGRTSFEDWLVSQITEGRRRDEFWTRQLGVFVPDPAAALRLLARCEHEHLKRAGQTDRTPGRTRDSRADLVDDLVAERQRLRDGEMLSWLQYAQDRFEARISGATVDEPSET